MSGRRRSGLRQTRPLLSRKFLPLMAAALLLATIAGTVLRQSPSARLFARQSRCSSNLSAISYALFQYQERYGVLPPRTIRNSKGETPHSWRFLLLPFLGEGRLYRSISYDEPWGSPQNAAASSICPAVYRCPNCELGERECSYFMTAAMRPGAEPKDAGRGSTGPEMEEQVLVFERCGSRLHWDDPEDADVSRFESSKATAHVGDDPGGLGFVLRSFRIGRTRSGRPSAD